MQNENLTDLEISKIEQFNADIEMVEAVKKVLLSTIYNQGVIKKGKKSNSLKNAALGLVFTTIRGGVIPNEKLGEDLRGMAHGINFLEAGLQELAKIKVAKLELPQKNTNEAV